MVASIQRLAALLPLLWPACSASSAFKGPVLVTGATGHTGVLLYKMLKAQGVEVRGLVRNATKAREVLGCQKCDASEGIFVGDVTAKETLAPAMAGAVSLAVLTSAAPICTAAPGGQGPPQNCTYPAGAFPIDIDFNGLKAQIEVFAEARRAAGGPPGHVVLCSSFGTTDPDNFYEKIGNGHILFYKLNGEAALASSGLPFTIVKPCGLTDSPAGQTTLLAGHDDEQTALKPPVVARGDVAKVMLEALRQPQEAAGLRFDLCSKPGPATTDFGAFFRSARYPWQQAPQQVVV